MHGFGQVADGCRTKRQVLDQSQNAHAVYSRHVTAGGEVFFQPFAGLRRRQIPLRRHGHHQSAGNVLGDA